MCHHNKPQQPPTIYWPGLYCNGWHLFLPSREWDLSVKWLTQWLVKRCQTTHCLNKYGSGPRIYCKPASMGFGKLRSEIGAGWCHLVQQWATHTGPERETVTNQLMMLSKYLKVLLSCQGKARGYQHFLRNMFHVAESFKTFNCG